MGEEENSFEEDLNEILEYAEDWINESMIGKVKAEELMRIKRFKNNVLSKQKVREALKEEYTNITRYPDGMVSSRHVLAMSRVYKKIGLE